MLDKKIELMTFDDYLSIINNQNKYHDSDAYKTNIYSLNKYDWVNEFSNIIEEFEMHGLTFQLKESIIDRMNFEYTKSVDDEGNVTSMSKEDKEKMFKHEERYEKQHAIIEKKTNKIVSMTSDEWGCLLIQTADEFRNLGLGQKLLNHHRSIYPFKDSGGHTDSGRKAAYRFYQHSIKEALDNNFYKNALENGDLSKEDISNILKSANLEKYDREINNRKNYDLNMDNSEDFLFLIEGNSIYMYNKKTFLSLNEDTDTNEHFLERGLLGYSYIGGNLLADNTPKIFRLFGKNEDIEKAIMEFSFNLFVGDNLKVSKEEDYLISDKLRENLIDCGEDKNKEFNTYILKKQTVDFLPMIKFLEKKFRQEYDKFDEKKSILQEKLYSHVESLTEKRIKIENIFDKYSGEYTRLDVKKKIRTLSEEMLEKLEDSLDLNKYDHKKLREIVHENLDSFYHIEKKSTLKMK